MVRISNNKTCATYAIIALLLVCGTVAAEQFREEGIVAESILEHYAGSNACSECHQEKHEDWAGKHMSNFVRYRRDVSGAPQGSWNASPINEKDVFVIIGIRRKLAFVDQYWKVFPYQYHFKKKKWQKRNNWAGRDYRLRCGPCHTTGLSPSTKQFVEINVGCEACHGPGKMHTKSPEREKMKVPGINDGHNVLITCRRCHNNRRNHARAIENFDGIFHTK